MADGKDSGAKITAHMLKSNAEYMRNWFSEGDVLIVDRGFRDVAELLNDCGIKTEMPHFLKNMISSIVPKRQISPDLSPKSDKW